MEKELEQMLQTVCSKGIKEASSEEIYAALLQWSKEKMNGMKHNEGDRKLYYISAEFLVGKLLSNNLINLGVFEEVREVLKKHGHDLTEIEEVELEPSLGTTDYSFRNFLITNSGKRKIHGSQKRAG